MKSLIKIVKRLNFWGEKPFSKKMLNFVILSEAKYLKKRFFAFLRKAQNDKFACENQHFLKKMPSKNAEFIFSKAEFLEKNYDFLFSKAKFPSQNYNFSPINAKIQATQTKASL